MLTVDDCVQLQDLKVWELVGKCDEIWMFQGYRLRRNIQALPTMDASSQHLHLAEMIRIFGFGIRVIAVLDLSGEFPERVRRRLRADLAFFESSMFPMVCVEILDQSSGKEGARERQ